jgi:hypothetical protein
MPYSPTWGDKHFQKGFRDALQNLNKAKREEVTRKRQQELTNLFEALRTASDLITDPRVRRWRPTPFKGVVTLRKGRLIEYRCQGALKAHVRCGYAIVLHIRRYVLVVGMRRLERRYVRMRLGIVPAELLLAAPDLVAVTIDHGR